MYVFATGGRIFKTRRSLMTLWRRMFTDEVMDSFFIICTFIEYRECEHRTYIVKEHYDWLKSSTSLSTLQKMSFSFWTWYCHATDCGGYGGRWRCRLIDSTSWCLSAIGDERWHQVQGFSWLKMRRRWYYPVYVHTMYLPFNWLKPKKFKQHYKCWSNYLIEENDNYKVTFYKKN